MTLNLFPPLITAELVELGYYYHNQGSWYYVSNVTMEKSGSTQKCSDEHNGKTVKLQTIEEMEFISLLLSSRATAGETVLPHYYIGEMIYVWSIKPVVK